MISLAKVNDLLDGESASGELILVDRLWPRGVAKDDFTPDAWLKDAAPSTELQKWFHGGGDFDDFARKYCHELDEGNDDIDDLLDRCKAGDVTLVYAARDREHNHAVVLRDWLEEQL